MFGGGFKSAKCKTLLRLGMARIKLLRNKRDVLVKQIRKDIAQLLSTGQDPSARIRVEHVAREQNIMAAYDMIELFCELIIVRLPIIESNKNCPMDLKEAISSLIFASPRCSDLPELLQIRSVFSTKFGKEFVSAALELRPDCGVNRRVIEKLSVRAPSGETKLKLLMEIAAEHHVNWDHEATLAELLKKPEDLLDGPKEFFGASQAPVQNLRPSPPNPNPNPKPTPNDAQASVSDPQRATLHPPARLPPPAIRPPTQLLSSSPPPPPQNHESPSKVGRQNSPKFDSSPSKLGRQNSPKFDSSPSKLGRHHSPKFDSSPSKLGRQNSPKFDSSPPQFDTRPAPKFDHNSNRPRETTTNTTSNSYEDVAAAAQAAAQSADRAVAAARVAARLAETHPFKKEQQQQIPQAPPSRAVSQGGGRKKQQPSSSSSDNDDYNDQRSDGRSNREPVKRQQQQQQQQGRGAGNCYITSDSYYRNGSNTTYR